MSFNVAELRYVLVDLLSFHFNYSQHGSFSMHVMSSATGTDRQLGRGGARSMYSLNHTEWCSNTITGSPVKLRCLRSKYGWENCEKRHNADGKR